MPATRPVEYNLAQMASLSGTRMERKRLGGGRLASIVLLYAFLLGLSVLTWFSARRAAETASWVDHTKTVLAEIDASLANVVRDTAIVRGYLLTGDLASSRPSIPRARTFSRI